MSEDPAANPPADSGEGSGITASIPESQPSQQDANANPVSSSYSSPFDIYGEEGVKQENLTKIPEEYSATRNFLGKYNSLKSLDDAIKHQGWLVRQKGFERPDPDAPEGDQVRFKETLKKVMNVPDTPEGFGIKKPENLSDEQWQQMGIDEYLKVASENFDKGLPAMMNALLELDMNRAKEVVGQTEQAQQKALADEHQAMLQKHGPKVEQMYRTADRIADMIGFSRSEIRDSHTVEAFNKVAELIGESRLPGANEGSNANAGMNHKDQAVDIMSNKSNPYHEAYMSGVPGNKGQAEVDRLMKLHAAATKGGSR